MKKSVFSKDIVLLPLKDIEISLGFVSEKVEILIYSSLAPYQNTVNPCC